MTANILVVDDEESVRFVLKTVLSRAGNQVLLAEDFDSACNIIKKKTLDLIIADIVLGERSGIEVLQQAGKSDDFCPVILITGKPDVATAADAVRYGAFDYLTKPVGKEQILRICDRAINHKRLLDEKRRLKEENEEYRRNLEAIFDSLMDGVITVNSELQLIKANQQAGEICGFSTFENAGRAWREIGGRCSKSCLGILKKTLENKEKIREFRTECQYEDREGQEVLLSSTPLLHKDGKFAGVVLAVRDISRLSRLEREIKERHHFHNIIGKSEKMQAVFRLLEDLAHTETTVLITGESGTGKELIARALHYSGLRANNQLVNVNCTTLTENLLESDLFGHVRGAFTGAVKERQGRFQMAHKGTIFLDEIGDISPLVQLKLLRVIQEREFEKVGSSVPIKVDVRLIAATNRNLQEMVRCGEFREDLYYRLRVVEVALPPLRERKADIPLLVEHFVALYRKKLNKEIREVSSEVLTRFLAYSWPGNVRELEHAIEHAFVVCREPVIGLEHLPSEFRRPSSAANREETLSPSREKEKLVETLDRTAWNKAKAARLLGLSRPTIYQKIKLFGLKPPS